MPNFGKNTQLIDAIENSFSLSLEQLLDLPGNVFWKNAAGIYQGYNDFGAEMLGFHQGRDIIKRNDYEIFPKPMAHLYRENDEYVMNQATSMHFSEKGFIKENIPVIFLSYKMPLFNRDKTVIGVLGISYTQLQNQIQFSLPSPNNLKNYNLTERELSCVSLLSQGLTAKQIGKKLNISFRTVESYLERVKEKYHCHNKAEMIALYLKNSIIDP